MRTRPTGSSTSAARKPSPRARETGRSWSHDSIAAGAVIDVTRACAGASPGWQRLREKPRDGDPRGNALTVGERVPSVKRMSRSRAKLTHLDRHGRARMVDVSPKKSTAREATARGRVFLHRDA